MGCHLLNVPRLFPDNELLSRSELTGIKQPRPLAGPVVCPFWERSFRLLDLEVVEAGGAGVAGPVIRQVVGAAGMVHPAEQALLSPARNDLRQPVVGGGPSRATAG
jgi:hypothetical protein